MLKNWQLAVIATAGVACFLVLYISTVTAQPVPTQESTYKVFVSTGITGARSVQADVIFNVDAVLDVKCNKGPAFPPTNWMFGCHVMLDGDGEPLGEVRFIGVGAKPHVIDGSLFEFDYLFVPIDLNANVTLLDIRDK